MEFKQDLQNKNAVSIGISKIRQSGTGARAKWCKSSLCTCVFLYQPLVAAHCGSEPLTVGASLAPVDCVKALKDSIHLTENQQESFLPWCPRTYILSIY